MQNPKKILFTSKEKQLSKIGATYRNMRETKGYKREYIAEKCGVSTDTIAKMEQGNIEVGICKLINYLQVIGHNLSDFAGQLPPPRKIRTLSFIGILYFVFWNFITKCESITNVFN